VESVVLKVWKPGRARVSLLVPVAVIALCLPISASAAQTYTDTINGFEYSYTSTDGRFAGTASGFLAGLWSVDVKHSPLCLSCTTTATITGGSFTIGTTLNFIPSPVTGRIASGTIHVVKRGASCTKQTFLLQGDLDSVGRGQGPNGSGTMTATLTHYRRSVLGRCVTYAAAVSGTINLNF
jgi:hypothetical protein